MSGKPKVSLAILAGPPDVSFLEKMVCHIVKANRFAFTRLTLVIDDLPLAKTNDPDALFALKRTAEELFAAGVINRILNLNVPTSLRDQWSQKHFGTRLKWDRDFRGIPLFGWIAGIEDDDSDYHVHFDCDVLLHQSSDFSWIERGIELLQEDATVLCVAPHPGPPAGPGQIHQRDAFNVDPRGFYRFHSFSSRRFLIKRRHYESILPLPVKFASRKHWLRSLFTHSSPIQNWEMLMNLRMQVLGLSRACIQDPRAWTLHAPDHGQGFREKLERIIVSVEKGIFPAQQAGHYDLQLQDWA